MNIITDKKRISGLIFLFSITYMISYITRINYGAVIAEMEGEFPRSLLSLAVTGSFITYGGGQIISGICGDKFSPKKLVSYGFILTILMNLLIPVCPNPYAMTAVWCVNGFAQAFMYPPLMRIMTTLFSENTFKDATVKVSWGSSCGTILVYLAAPLIISIVSWRGVFVFSALCAIAMLFVWNKFCPEITNESITVMEKQKQSAIGKKALFAPVMIAIMVAIVLQGALKDGVTTWMPSYISDTYNMSSIVSILTGVLLPLFGIVSFKFASYLYCKKITNPVACGGTLFAVGAVSAFALIFVTGRNVALSVLASALLTGSMNGVNLIIVCMIPAFFRKYGNVSTVSGVLNSCTYIGSAISTYGIAVVSERMGWIFTLCIWFGITLAGTAICLLCIKPWKKYIRKQFTH